MLSTRKKMDCGVYSITHIDSGKGYIGSSKTIRRRLCGHRNLLSKNKHPNCHLQAAWDKYGKNSFVFSTVLFCRPEDRIFYEQNIIDRFRVTNNKYGYNLSLKASHPEHSKETINKIKEKLNLARKQGKRAGHYMPHTKEAKEKIIIALKRAKAEGRVGGHFKRHTKKAKIKISEALKGNIPWNKGEKLSFEHTEKSKKTKSELFRNPEFLAKWNARKITYCKNNHLLSGDNLYIDPTGGRVCRICRRMRVIKHRMIHPRRRGS